MTEGPFIIALPADVVAAVQRLRSVLAAPYVRRVLNDSDVTVATDLVLFEQLADVCSAQLAARAAGSMQASSSVPVHVARARQKSAQGTALPVCDVDALGVVTEDRNLADCAACLHLIDERTQHPCPLSCNDGMIERLATPEEVDNGHELGIAFDPCPACNPDSVKRREMVDRADVDAVAGAMRRSRDLDEPTLHRAGDVLDGRDDLPQPGVPTTDLLAP